MDISFQELVKGLNGEVLVENPYKSFNILSTDTRKIEKDNIFLALKGENFNGNKYLKQAVEKGASIVIIDEILEDLKQYEGKVNIIKVNDCNKSLLSLAKFYREKINVKVVGITGSCGKTSTKDLLAAFLSTKYKVFKTKGNFNNHIGLPLMILQMDSTYDIAVLELGMSNLGEIHTLANCAMPDIGLITNIGLSHIENLKTQENILQAKMEITDFFNKDSILIVNGEDKYLNSIEKKQFKVIKTSLKEGKEIYAKNIEIKEQSTKFKLCYKNNEYDFVLPMVGEHNVLNALIAIKAAVELNVSFEEMKKGLINIENTSMRLEFIKTNNITIINDCYNASPDSMKAALKVLNNTNGNRKVAILGTMRELGEESKKAHKDVASFAKDTADMLLVCGEYTNDYKLGFEGNNIKIYNTKDELIKDLNNNIKKDDVILVKASRGAKFEEIVEGLKNVRFI